MKIFVLKKKYLCIFILLIFIIATCIIYNLFNISFAISLDTSNFLTEEIKEKFSSLQKQNEKIAYLTFDDGPTLKATEKILDILKEENVKASFFVIGKHVKEHPELVKREYEEGHFIGNHGYNHSNSKLYSSDQNFISEIKNTDEEIAKAIGVDNYCSHVFRFPNGYMSANYKAKKKHCAELLSQMDYVYVDWNCLNKDSEYKVSQYQLLNNLKKTAKNKGTLIILMHDTNDVNKTTEVLKDSISFLRKQGYTFENFYNLIQ